MPDKLTPDAWMRFKSLLEETSPPLTAAQRIRVKQQTPKLQDPGILPPGLELGLLGASFIPGLQPVTLPALTAAAGLRATTGILNKDPVQAGLGLVDILPVGRAFKKAGKVINTAQKTARGTNAARKLDIFNRLKLAGLSNKQLRAVRTPSKNIVSTQSPKFRVLPKEPAQQRITHLAQLPDAERLAQDVSKAGQVSRLGKFHRQALGRLNRLNTEAFVRMANKPRGLIKPEEGFSVAELAPRIGLAGLGAAVGATQGEDTQDRINNAVLFGVGGALIPSVLQSGPALQGLRNVMMKASQGMKGFNKNSIDNYRYFSMLSRPLTIAKAHAGALGGFIAKELELLASGRTKQALAALDNLRKTGAQTYMEALDKPEKFLHLRGGARGLDVPIEAIKNKGVISWPTRLIGAADTTMLNAFQKAGIVGKELEDVRTLALSGRPTSQFGQDFLDLMNKHWWTKWIQPFPRVGFQSFERGIEFSPLGAIPQVSKAIRGGRNVFPLTQAQRLARAGTGTAAIGAGVAAGSQIDVEDRSNLFLGTATAGPAQLGTLLGFIIGEGIQRGQLTTQTANDIINQLRFELPTSDVNDLTRVLRGEQFIPGILDVIGRATDPRERETRGQGFFAPAMRKIPFLREQLPPKRPQRARRAR